MLTTAKSKVALLGSDDVVKNLNTFYDEHGVLDSEKAVLAFFKIVNAMRRDLSGNSNADLSVLNNSSFALFFGSFRDLRPKSVNPALNGFNLALKICKL
jgi:hypothetical protein